MRVDLEAEPDLLEDGVGLVLPGLTVLDRRLVLELSEVHELADRRPRLGGDFDKVEVGLLGETQRVFDPDDADLLPVGADQPHLWDADTVVNPGLADVLLLRTVSVTAGKQEKAPGCRRSGASVTVARQTDLPFACTPTSHGRGLLLVGRSGPGPDVIAPKCCDGGWERLHLAHQALSRTHP
ncbi:hypothetical protein GCM10022223_49950 [Kineosporia mesophila]|uniref:Uncharacterized protein n=1 Tax=Kineosporia mesophila TaxID=566012 RepID=A0ABP7A7U5_9ACTN